MVTVQKEEHTGVENVQRRATKRFKQLKNLSYEDRLKKLNLITLEERRIRGDLIQFFKFHSNINTINWHLEPTIDVSCRPRRTSNQNRLVRPPPATCPQRGKFLHVQSCHTLEFPTLRNNSIGKCKSIQE